MDMVLAGGNKMKAYNVYFIGEHGEILIEKKLTALHLKDEVIIEKSIEFFNDPEPCMIHRSAVMKRIYMEINEFFLLAMKDGKLEVLCDSLPSSILAALDIQKVVQSIRFDF